MRMTKNDFITALIATFGAGYLLGLMFSYVWCQ